MSSINQIAIEYLRKLVLLPW